MVNHETSESLLDKLILQVFEDQEDTFSFPLTTMKQTRDFIRLLNHRGFTYEMISAEIDEKFEAFRSWRLGGGPDTIGRRMMTRINKPLQEAMLSDEEEEDEEEVLKNGTTEGKATGGARRKKSTDGGGSRRGSRVDKKGKVKEAKGISEENGVKKRDSEKKGEVKGQESVEAVQIQKTDTTDGKNALDACDEHSKPSALNNDVQLPNSGKSENAKVDEKRDATGKDNTGTTVATAKDATPNNGIKSSKDQSPKTDRGRQEPLKEDLTETTNRDIDAHLAKKDVSKEHGKSTDARKEQEAEAGKKELETSTETKQKELETNTETKQKELETSTETKQKARAEAEPKSSDTSASKLETDEKPRSSNEDLKKLNDVATKNEQRSSTANRKQDGVRVEQKAKTTSADRTPTKPSDVSLEKKLPAEKGPGSPDQPTTASPTQDQDPISSISPPFKPGPPATDSRHIPEVQTPSKKEKNSTDNLPNTPSDAGTASKILETACPSIKEPSHSARASLSEQKSEAAKPKDKTVKTDKHSDTKTPPEESKISSTTSQSDKAVPKNPEKETIAPCTLTTENHVMAKPANVIRSKSETVEPKIDKTPTSSQLTRTSSDSADPFRCSATPASPKPDPPSITKTPPSDANQPEVDENYDSDLDAEISDRSAEDRVLIERLCSLKRNETKDGPGHLFVFSDTPAATGTGKHRVRIGISRFPEKRLQQAQMFNPDIRMVTSVAVATRKDALCRAQEELKSMSLRGKRGWYWGSLDVILQVLTNLPSVKDEAIE